MQHLSIAYRIRRLFAAAYIFPFIAMSACASSPQPQPRPPADIPTFERFNRVTKMGHINPAYDDEWWQAQVMDQEDSTNDPCALYYQLVDGLNDNTRYVSRYIFSAADMDIHIEVGTTSQVRGVTLDTVTLQCEGKRDCIKGTSTLKGRTPESAKMNEIQLYAFDPDDAMEVRLDIHRFIAACKQ